MKLLGTENFLQQGQLCKNYVKNIHIRPKLHVEIYTV